jgi:predicted Zn-ribbon and HTH transcriptional regulator
MGEQADLIINGDVCEGCGENFDDEGDGYPRRCSSCRGGSRPWKNGKNPVKQERMKEAEKLFKAAGFTWQSFNNNYHWRVAGIDFFPTTERWFDTKNDFHGQGVKEFIRYVQGRENAQKKLNKVLTIEQIFEIAKSSKDKSLFGICETIHRGIYP